MIFNVRNSTSFITQIKRAISALSMKQIQYNHYVCKVTNHLRSAYVRSSQIKFITVALHAALTE